MKAHLAEVVIALVALAVVLHLLADALPVLAVLFGMAVILALLTYYMH